ncbi:MAG: phosphoribosyltransferase family protein [Kiritimatiellae bacterium]|nr:phosphoribosyltransferase family protein [Kiritimatiellia bacterium]
MKIIKRYLSAEEYHLDSFRLGRMIIDSGWVPDDMIALWRGGAPVGVIVHEFLHYHGFRPRHRALKCQSYTGIKAHTPEVFFENADEIFNSIIPGSRVLIVDDVFDTGNTAQAVVQRLAPFKLDLKFATVFWKPEQNQTELQPDFYVVKTDQWIVFPHELDGLTKQEVKLKHPAIYDLLVMDLLQKR